MRNAMENRNLTEAAVAKSLGCTRADLAAALRGDLDRFSISELKAFVQSLEAEANGQKEAAMNKIPLSDGSGHWFDLNSAKKWQRILSWREDGDDSHGEALYLTTNGAFIHNTWNGMIGEDLYFRIDHDKAARWLIANGYQKDIPQLEFQSEEKKLEV